MEELISKQVPYEKCVQIPRQECDRGVCKQVFDEHCDTLYETKYETILKKGTKLSVSVGFTIPKGFGGVGIPYKACYAEEKWLDTSCEDGKLYLFGGSKDVTSDTPVNKENYDIHTSLLFTREIKDHDNTFTWESLELLDYENSLPIDAPLFMVVQIANGDKDYTFAQLQEGVQKGGYGNLLDDYNDVKDYGYPLENLSSLLNK